MDKQDIRKLPASAREQMRRTCVRLHQHGHSQVSISAQLGINRTTITKWIQAYKAGGSAALKEATRGRRTGSGRQLSPEQEARIQREIIDKTPDQLKLSFTLWNAQAVRLLIKNLFGQLLPIRTVRHYLKGWGFTPQRALKRAYEQQPKAVRKWLDDTYPRIVKRAKEEGAQISWADESAASSVEHFARGYAPKGNTPVLVLSQARRERINMISAITNQGLLRFMLYQDSLDADTFIGFLKRLIKESERKVFLIVDNLKVHHAIKVSRWGDEHVGQIELFYLPSYSPELNPDEYLNADLKARLNAGEPVRSAKALKGKLLSHLRSLQKQPKRIRSYFEHEMIRYAA